MNYHNLDQNTTVGEAVLSSHKRIIRTVSERSAITASDILTTVLMSKYLGEI